MAQRHHQRGQQGGQRGRGRGGPRTGLVFPTRNDLPADVRQSVVELLNQSLADTTDLLTQAKFAHWNVKGVEFFQLHLLFDEIAETLISHQDLIAERAAALGGQALGTVRMSASNTQIPEIPSNAVTGKEYLQALADNLAIHAANLREAIDIADGYRDEDTMDLYTEISREVDKQLWFLEAHLQTQPITYGRNTGNLTGFQSETSGGPANSEDTASSEDTGSGSGSSRGTASAGQSAAEYGTERAQHQANGGRRYGQSPHGSEFQGGQMGR